MGALLLGSAVLHAFPPAPFYTIYGDVRDQYGVLLAPEGAYVIVSYGGKEVLRQPLVNRGEGDYNYQARLRVDMMRLSSSSYSSIALDPGSTYSLSVSVGGQIYYPFEVETPPQLGNPADRQRIDLTLGVDSDGDRLPDAWEESQLFHKGYQPGSDGWDLSLLDWEGDFDEDGVSNGAEYLAGTYATDPDIEFNLAVRQVVGGQVRLEFYALYNKTYALSASTNLVDWTEIPFSLADADAEPVASIKATTTGVVSLYTETAGPATFYRLHVR